MARQSISDKEQMLRDKIEQHKQQLMLLQKKQKLELGTLAYKHGLHTVDFNVLDAAFLKLSEELKRESAEAN
jgi:hypothetical protein